MLESNVDCDVCIHNKICKHIENVKFLNPIAAEISFKCREFIHKDKLSLFSTDKNDKDSKNNKASAKNLRVKCHICGKETPNYVICENCKKPCCTNCYEKVEYINVNDISNTAEKNLCIKCSYEEGVD